MTKKIFLYFIKMMLAAAIASPGAMAAYNPNAIDILSGDVAATGNTTGNTTATIQPNVVTNSKLAQIPGTTLKGNNTGLTANVSDLSALQVSDLLAPYLTQPLSTPATAPFSLLNQTSVPTALSKLTSVSVLGNYAYVAGAVAATLSIFNITNPYAPMLLSSMTTLAGAYDVFPFIVSGTTYVLVPSSGSHTLYVINASNPSIPTITTSFVMPGSPGSLYSAAYSSGYAYISTQNLGFTVVDLGGGGCGGTLTAPVQCFQEGGTTNKAFGVALGSNGYIFTTNYSTSSPYTIRQIKSWTTTGSGSSSIPSLVESYQITTAGEALAISVSGNTAYVSSEATGVYGVDVIDITTPSAMNNLSVITPSNSLSPAMSAVQIGNFAFIPSGTNATYGGSIDMIDMSNRSAPFIVGTVKTNVANSAFGGITANNGFLYAADYGPAPGSIGNLDVFSDAYTNLTATNGLFKTLFANSITGTLTGNASSASALASTPTQCNSNQFATGIAANGAANCSSATVNPGSSFITSGTSFTTPSTTVANSLFKFTLIGGGGGGGGSSGLSNGSGGGAGAVCIVYLSGLSASTSYSVTIGGAGAAGTLAPTAGGAGGNTTLTIGSTVYSAGGGGGGSASGGGGIGGVGGVCANTLISISGQNGANGLPMGGSNMMGFGGASSLVGSNSPGVAATGYGGGGGAGSSALLGSAIGAAGTTGAILVEWGN